MAHMGGEVQPGSVPDSEALVGQLIGGIYRVEHLLGHGRRTAVWACVNERTGGRVALKMIRRPSANTPEARSLLQSELRAASGISHPNVVSVFEVIEHEGMTCMVMEYLEGESLGSFIERRGPLRAREATGLLLPAMRGVATAHALGVIHRDLRPQNVFVCIGPDGRVVTTKVLDFGISRLLEAGRERSAEPMVTVLGTPAHMAPEQFDKSKVSDERTDVYGFGVLFYEALTAKPPFPGEPDLELLRRVLSEPPPALASLRPDLPAGLVAIVEKAMAKEPEERYAGLDAMMTAVEDECLRFAPDPPAAQAQEAPSDTPAPAATTGEPSPGVAGELGVGTAKAARPRAETLVQVSGALGSTALPDWAVHGTVRPDDEVPRTHWAWRGLVILGILLALGYVFRTYREVTRRREAATNATYVPVPTSASMPAGQAPPAAPEAPPPGGVPAPVTARAPMAAPASPSARDLARGPMLPAASAPSAAGATPAAEEPPASPPPRERSSAKTARRRRQEARAEPVAEKTATKARASTPAAPPVAAGEVPAATLRAATPMAPLAPAADKPRQDESAPGRAAKPRAGNLTQDDF